MKKILILLLGLCLLLGGCSRVRPLSPDEMPAQELLSTASYDLTATALAEGLTVRQQLCAVGDALYFLADTPAESDLPYDVFESRLYRLDLSTGEMALLTDFAPAESAEESYSAVTALFPGQDDTLWVMENTTHYIFDLPKNFDESRRDKWEYYQYRGDSTQFRQLDTDGRELNAIALTNLQSSLTAAIAWGENLLCAQGTELFVLQTDGTVLRVLSVPGWVTALVPMGDSAAVLTDHEQDGICRLYTLSPDLTLDAGKALPTAVYEPAGLWDDTLYFTERGNLFAWSPDEAAGKKLLDWQDYDRSRSHISHLRVLEDGALLALSQSEQAGLELLQLTPDAAPRQSGANLTLGAYLPDSSATELVLDFCRKTGKRIRVIDYGEYAALGLDGLAALQRDISENRTPDLFFSDDPTRPVTALAPDSLADLSSYLEEDALLQTQGLMTSVFDALRAENGKLYTVTPSFHLLTTVGRGDILTPLPLTAQRIAELAASLPSDGFSPVDLYTTRDAALQEHLSRRAGDYLQTGNWLLTEEAFSQGLALSALYPETINWRTYERKGPAEGWLRVRRGNQLFLSGTYSSFSALAYDMNAVGENAVLAGWPDVPGGHAVAVWESWGMAQSCRDKTLAWSFLRNLLLEQTQTTRTLSGLPTNRAAFGRLGRAAMQSSSSTQFLDGEETIELSSRLTEQQFAAIEQAVNSTKTLSQSAPETLSVAICNKIPGYYTGALSAEAATAEAQTAVDAYFGRS